MLLLDFLISTFGSILGSLGALAIWFHFDLDGWWDQHRHERIIKKERKRDNLIHNPSFEATAHGFEAAACEFCRNDKWDQTAEATARDFYYDGYPS